jgi:hypothetical protein
VLGEQAVAQADLTPIQTSLVMVVVADIYKHSPSCSQQQLIELEWAVVLVVVHPMLPVQAAEPEDTTAEDLAVMPEDLVARGQVVGVVEPQPFIHPHTLY